MAINDYNYSNSLIKTNLSNQTLSWKLKNGELVTKEKPGTCKRDIFECDKRLAIKLAQENWSYDENFHLFHTKNGFDYKEEFWCHSSSEVAQPSDPGCCQPDAKDTAFIRYNKLHKYI